MFPHALPSARHSDKCTHTHTQPLVPHKTRLKAMAKSVQLTKWLQDRQSHRGLDEEQRAEQRRNNITNNIEKKITAYLAKNDLNDDG